jgi:hypothetical protein
MVFQNNGTVGITGTAIMKVFAPTGEEVHEFQHEITDLMPAGSIGFGDMWDAAEESYSVVGYVMYDSKATEPAVVTVQWESSPPVGGIAELPDLAGTSAEEAVASPEGSGWSAGDYAALAGGLAAAALAIAAGAWYARRRWLG